MQFIVAHNKDNTLSNFVVFVIGLDYCVINRNNLSLFMYSHSVKWGTKLVFSNCYKNVQKITGLVENGIGLFVRN